MKTVDARNRLNSWDGIGSLAFYVSGCIFLRFVCFVVLNVWSSLENNLMFRMGVFSRVFEMF